jgi:hypothetical protein
MSTAQRLLHWAGTDAAGEMSGADSIFASSGLGRLLIGDGMTKPSKLVDHCKVTVHDWEIR